MEDRRVLRVIGEQFSPGCSPELTARFLKWQEGSYVPLLMKLPSTRGIDRYEIVNPSPLFPFGLNTHHHGNKEEVEKGFKDPTRRAVSTDVQTWIDRRVLQHFWIGSYELIKGFRNESGQVVTTQETLVEDVPLLHLEGYRLPQEDQDKYEKWLDDYGFNAFIPLMMKLPGIKGYDCYKDTGLKGSGIIQLREWEYPDHLSLLYFENQKAFEDYTKSSELLAFQKAIGNIFPNGLNLRWYVQYQLVKSWRK